MPFELGNMMNENLRLYGITNLNVMETVVIPFLSGTNTH
jgi:hypothetical protein